VKTILLHQILYRLFAWLFLYPDADRLEILRQGAEEILALEPLWGTEIYAGWLKKVLKYLIRLDENATNELINEHNRLFLIKPLAPAYESIYIAPQGQARGWIAAQVERIYARFNLAMADLNELPDHLAVELEFLSFLCGEQAGAFEAGDTAQVQAYRRAQEDFLEQHLRRWVPLFHQRISQWEAEGFYHCVLEALIDFLRTTHPSEENLTATSQAHR
jgi:DMSO reductase family type II enzyme chaperone